MVLPQSKPFTSHGYTMRLKHYDRYLRQMLSHGHGLALWEPEPDQTYDKVEIADVGYIQRGHFLRLFNCSLPIGDVRNKLGVPEGYEPLKLDPTNNTVEALQARQPLWSSDVKVIHSRLHVSPMPTVGSCVGFQANIQTSSGSGAMLFTGQEMHAQDAPQTLDFENYITKNHESWLTFARFRGRKVELEDLIMVTGRHLTADFAMFSFSEANRDAEIGFDLGFPSIASGSFSLSFRSTHVTSPAINSGPRSAPAPNSSTIQNETSAQSVSDGFTQCVFLRGYRVKKRKMRFPKVIKAAAGPHDLGPGERFERYLEPLRAENNSDSSSDDLEFVSDTGPALDPAHPLLDYILANSEASLALVHDDDLGQLYKNYPIESHVNLDDIITKMSPSLEVHGGVGRLALGGRALDNLSSKPAIASQWTSFSEHIESSEVMDNINSQNGPVGEYGVLSFDNHDRETFGHTAYKHTTPPAPPVSFLRNGQAVNASRHTPASQRPIRPWIVGSSLIRPMTDTTRPSGMADNLALPNITPTSAYRSIYPSTSSMRSPPIINSNATLGHEIREIPIPVGDHTRYIRPPTSAEMMSGWRAGYVKCVFKGCSSPAVEPSRVATHLAIHVHAGKTHECTCGTRFSRLSEAKRHLDDTSPCELCKQSRRKIKGTRFCGHCIGSQPYA